MNSNNWRRFAPVGLYLSLFAALAALVFYVLQRQFSLGVQISLGVIVIGVALYAILDPARVRTIATGRQARYGSNALVLSLAFVGILVVINLIVNNYSKQWDLTTSKSNTLAPETIQALQKLTQPVTALAFFTNQSSPDAARSLLEEYKAHSNGKFSYQFIDPNANPVAANNALVTQDATIVVEIGKQQEKITTIDENDLTNALIRVSNPSQRTVYFLTGHGELDLTGTADKSFAGIKTALEAKNYTVKQLNLISTPQIPADALAIIIAGPQKPISADEVKLLKAYVDQGKSLVVMEQPTVVTQFDDLPDPLAAYLTQDWGITLGNDMIIDLSSNSPTVAVANEYGSHAITDKLNNMVTIFPSARSVQATAVQNITQTVLAKTSSNSWAETDLAALQNNQVTFDKTKDLAGPVPLAVAAENSTTTARVVVFGDVDFASDAYYTSYGNSDLIVNSIDWSAKQDQLINLTTKTPTQTVLVPPKAYTIGLIFLGTVIFIPGIVIVAGIVVWVKRKRRG